MGTKVIIKDFSKVEYFINSLDKIIDTMYDCQGTINSSYNRVGDWDDIVFITTGNLLTETTMAIKDFGEYLGDKMLVLNSYCRHVYCNYAEYKEWSGKFKSESERNLSAVINVKEKSMVEGIFGTTAEGIISFERQLSKYIEKTENNVNDIIKQINNVGDYWCDDNYKKTQDIIAGFKKDMYQCLEDLKTLLSYIEKRRKELEASEDILKNYGN